MTYAIVGYVEYAATSSDHKIKLNNNFVFFNILRILTGRLPYGQLVVLTDSAFKGKKSCNFIH